MKLSTAVILATAIPGAHAGAENDPVTPGEHGLSFSPLQCNVDASPPIESEECRDSGVPLSSLVGASAAGAPVTIPCGTCAYVDTTDGSTVTLPDGLNVVGRLHFPSTANVVLNTTSVIVQGHFDMLVPDVGNAVKITLYGTEEHFLYPHEHCCDSVVEQGRRASLRKLSTGPAGCAEDCAHKKAVGKKPFVVAGGQLDIRTIDPTCPSWTTLKDVGMITDPNDETKEVGKNFVVDPNFARCVRRGDDLIVTSDRIGEWWNHFEWVADSINEADGVVAMEGHTSRQFATEAGPGEPYFATEVANLRRDVVFEAQKDDEDELVGGHMMIFHTPGVVQTIEGVRLVNFGQAGNLGRYPIHFHMCGPSPSTVSKNVIIHSNQRCVVIHNTNEVTIDDNVAYKTRGHCYVTETGAEINNKFIHNLGAETTILNAINGQSDSTDGKAHHNEPSTFWIRNGQNTWIGNVAAGAQVNGWWFEMFNQKFTPLDVFKDNAAHSSKQGLITYPGGGFQPSNDAVIENFRTYKNKGNSGGDGFKFFSSGSFTIKNTIMADNLLGIKEFFNSAPITVQDSRFIGLSEDARLRLGMTCAAGNGLRFSYNTDNQMQLKNVTFENYGNCRKAIAPYPELRFGGERMMGEPLGTKEVTLEEGQDPLANDGAWTMYMEDVNGTMGPSNMGPGFFVENTPRLTAFIPSEQCSTVSTNTKYCENVCLRHMEVFPDNQHAAEATKYEKLVLTKTEADGTSMTFAYDHADSYSSNHFDVLLPAGEYNGHFLNETGDVMNARGVHVDARNPPLRACDYASPSSLTFVLNPYPKARFVNYGAGGKYLWAGESGGPNARPEIDPIEETEWTVEEVECPANPQYSIPGGSCYILVGGGSSRRKLYAESNRPWTSGVGASAGTAVHGHHKWKFLRTECDVSDTRPCVYLVNAQNGRILYKHDTKTDFGASPGGEKHTANWFRWYMEDVGGDDSISELDIATSTPTAVPTSAPTITSSPSASPTPGAKLKFVNVGAGGADIGSESKTYMWVKESDEYWNGVGAGVNPTDETEFTLEETSCPSANSYSIPGDTCYLLIGGGAKKRKVFATNDVRQWRYGMGASSGGIKNEQKWKLISAKCDPSDARPCVYITSAYNGRKLVKDSTAGQSFSGQFGGTKVGRHTHGHDDTKWYIEGSTAVTSALDIADVPLDTTMVRISNYVTGKTLWAKDKNYAWGDVWASIDSDHETGWGLEEVACPSNNPYSIPGEMCYAFYSAGLYRRRLFAQSNPVWNSGIGADHGTKLWDDQKWRLLHAPCGDSSAPDQTCVHIVNAVNGRRLYSSTATGEFGATPQGVVNDHDETMWLLEDVGVGAALAVSSLSVAPSPGVPQRVQITNTNTGNDDVRYLYAKDMKWDWNHLGAHVNPTSINPTYETSWIIDTVDCPPSPSYTSLIPNDPCVIIKSDAVYQRRLFAKTNDIWTRGVGASFSTTIYSDQKWQLLPTTCASGGDCVFIVNAQNGRRLYKDLNKPDFGCSPKDREDTGDAYKWRINEF